MNRPECIVCHAPIRKRTRTIYFNPSDNRADGKTHDVRRDNHAITLSMPMVEIPTSREEAEKMARQHTNDQFVSIAYGVAGTTERKVGKLGTWDGESYEDKFFCSGTCAKKQGYASARHGERFTWG